MTPATSQIRRRRPTLPVLGPCPTPDKDKFFTRGEANPTRVKMIRCGRGGPHLRVYDCRCGYYHIGNNRQL